ncbi:hypothetical protein B0T22DRAFT_201206 [Podospora appendiculata]|uniref:Uncharacterized protein n=1 Tax=Podospora appendiculata TaxID=314037 RepID=A0AAE0X490_9PEZI|nr:hypothetical protein B0T22DRAFT_201206 [Podospora appendiculata]
MNFRALVGCLLAVASFGQLAEADFTNSFNALTAGSTAVLTWDAVPSGFGPLYITAQLIDRSADGTKVNGYKANITTSVTGNSFSWTTLPYPLRWIQSGMYQLELRPSTWAEGEQPVLAKSSFFKIDEAVAVTDPPSSSPSSSPTSVTTPENNASGIRKQLAIGLGVALGIPSLVALGFVSWCLRRRHRRAALVKRRLKRSEFIIN